VSDVDRFVSVSEYYAPVMSGLLQIPPSRMAVVPLGINLTGYERRSPPGDVFRVGYFARIAPEKGLHVLADAYVRFRERSGNVRTRLDAAGYLAPTQAAYLAEVRDSLNAAGVGQEFTYHGAVDRAAKVSFLRTLQAFSVPTPYDEPKGVFLLEAMGVGLPVVQPRRGAFTEIVDRTGGGVLVPPDDSMALGDAIYDVWRDPAAAERFGNRGFDGVRQHYSIARSTDRLLAVYEGVIRGGSAGAPHSDPSLAASR
jgi:glycosyltransferase involved in cell wall biosynthesis